MTTLTDAFKQVRSSDQLSQEFTQDPRGVMERLGVDTSNLQVSQTKAPGDAPVGAAADINACVSIGCIACASIG